MNNRLLYIIVSFTALVFLSSCLEQMVSIPDEPDTPLAEKVQLELSMRTDEYRTPVLRSLADENGIDTTSMVLIFSGTGDNAVFVESVKAFALNGIDKHYIMPTKQAGHCRLLILSNPRDSFYMSADNMLYAFTASKIDSLFNGKTLSYACANMLTESLNNPQTSVPYAGNKRIPMSYLLDVSSINENTQIGTSASPLEMKRVTAKIVIKNDLPDFIFSGITAVVNAPKQGQLHLLGTALMNNTGNLTEYNAGDSYATELITATINGSGQTTEDDPVYLYESGTPNNTYIIIKGVYKGKNYYYKLLPVSSGKVPLNLLRNHQYTIDITSVEGPGFETVSDLKLAGVATAIDYDVKIVDEAAFETLANSSYYLSVSNSVFIAYTDATGGNDIEFDLFTLTTNCTYDFQKDRYITHNNWSSEINLTYPAPDHSGAGQKSLIPIAVNSSTPVASAVKAYVRSSLNDGYVTLKLGDLEKSISVSSAGSALPASGGILEIKDPYGNSYYCFSGYIAETNTKDWIKLTSASDVVRNDSASIVVDDGVIRLHVTPNTTGSERRGVVYLNAGKNPWYDPPGGEHVSSFRIKVDIAQRNN